MALLHQLKRREKFDIPICYKQRQTFHVTKSSPQGVLSYETSSELGILAVEINNITSTNHDQAEIQALLDNHQPLNSP